MYSALYYPHSTVKSQSLLKTALLMWDELHVIVPWDNFAFSYASALEHEAMDLIGHLRVPKLEEQKAAHELIEDFVSRPLPPAFAYSDTTGAPYELYPQKFMNETWELLRSAKLAGAALPNSDVPTARQTGLSLMSILADCCAGETLTRVTDQGDAYAFLSDVVVDKDSNAEVNEATNALVSIPVKIASVDEIPLERLVDLRRREVAGKAGGLPQLRHNLIDKINEQTSELVAAKTKADQDEITRQFEQFLREDLRELREALKLETTKVLSAKVVMGSVLGVVGILGAPILAPILPAVGAALGALGATAGLIKAGAAAGAIGGLINTNAKFAQTRLGILKKHPTAYLYDALGGPIHL